MDRDAELRNRLFLNRLKRELGHARVLAESRVTRRLHDEIHATVAESRRLRRRGRWLRRTKQPLPTVIG
jgi:hypothetical protein